MTDFAATIMASQVASVSTSEEALVDYQEEMRASREELLKTIARSSEDIAGRCRDAMERTKDDVHASLFDDEERERVVEAYAAKLKASREEMIAKIEEQQAAERARLVDDLRSDVDGIMNRVVETLRTEMAGAHREREREEARLREAHCAKVLDDHATEVRAFNQKQLDGLRDAMAAHRDEAVKKYQQEMALFRDDQLDELNKVNFADLKVEYDTDDAELDDAAHRAAIAAQRGAAASPPGSPPRYDA